MVCGPQNPDGWGVTFAIEGSGRVSATVTFDGRHEGAPGWVHGGAVAAVLDDALGSVLVGLETPAVTANLNIDFRAGARVGRPLLAEAWCERVKGRKLYLAGRLSDGETLLAETRGLFLEVPREHFQPI